MFWLIIVFLTFIFLGFPASIISSMWPYMSLSLNVDETSLGYIMGTYMFFNVIMLTISSYLIKKVGIKNIIAIGLLCLCFSMIIMAITKTYNFYIISAIILGIGAGITDTSSNYYIARYYKPKYLTWIHCAWGFGSSIAPLIMNLIISLGFSYRYGYFVFIPLFLILSLIILIASKFENKKLIENISLHNEQTEKNYSIIEILKTKNAPLFLLYMFLIDFMFNAVAIWFCTFVIELYGISDLTAPKMLSLFFVGLTISRMGSGFIVEKIGVNKIIYSSFLIYFIGSILLLFNFKNDTIYFISAFLLGFGVAPSYPLAMNCAKYVFGEEKLKNVIGIAGSSAKAGSCVSSFIIAFIINIFTMNSFTYVLIINCILTILIFYIINKK